MAAAEPQTEIPEEIRELGFEPAFQKLEEVVARMESEELPLEEALALFERGVALTRHCRQLLEDAERRVTQLTADGVESPFPDDGQDDGPT